jgi:hypothetical protein
MNFEDADADPPMLVEFSWLELKKDLSDRIRKIRI